MTRLTEFHKEDLLDLIEECKGTGSSAFFVIDSRVFALYPSLFSRLRREDCFVFEASEENKSLERIRALFECLIERNLSRSDLLVAIGGGICGDFSAFAASTYMRGMRLINVPTSLLAMVDASIGGKTGLNFKNYKNMIGSFYEAEEILIDAGFLETLPEHEFRTGLCEMIKIAAVLDETYFERLEELPAEGIREAILPLIRRAQDLKAGIVEGDFRDRGSRNALNFGHSIGHALEELHLARGERLSHGIAVAIGMAEIMKRSLERGLCEKSAHDRLLAILEKFGLPRNTEEDLEDLFRYLLHDKKRRGDRHRLVLSPQIGSFRILELGTEELKEFMGL